MATNELEFIVRSVGHDEPGVELGPLLSKLTAIERLYAASVAAEVKPGSARTRLPKEVRELAKVLVTKATAASSLNVDVRLPSTPAAYMGGYASLPDRANARFRGILGAAAGRDADAVVSWFPEKADRTRALNAVSELANGGGVGVGIRGIADEPVYLAAEVAGWAEKQRPTSESERRTFVGLVKRGQLGGGGRFVVTDGRLSIPVRPEHGWADRFKRLFGEVVQIRGQVTYGPEMRIREMDKIESAEPFAYSTDRITASGRVFDLRRPLVYSASSDPETAEGFMLFNEELQSYAYGRTLDDAIDEIGEEFSALWDEIVLEDEDNLHESARHLKFALLGLVEDVEKDG